MADLAFRLRLPEGWTQLDAEDPSVLLVAVEPDDGQPFRSNLVVTAGSLGGLTLRDWQVGSDASLPRALTDYLLLDLEHVEVDGHPGVRRLAHHSAGGAAVTLEQWATVVDDVGWTLTATVPTMAWAAAQPEVAEVAAGWRPGR